MNSNLVIATASCFCVFLSGCATPANVEQMTYTTEDSKKAPSYSPYYKSVIIKQVGGGSETNPLFSSQVSATDLKGALEESLKQANYLSNTSMGKYKLTADLVGLDQPFMGINMTVRAAIDYKIEDNESGRILLEDSIETPFTATMSDAFIGVERLRLANEGAIKRNIQKLIDKLSSLARTSKA